MAKKTVMNQVEALLWDAGKDSRAWRHKIARSTEQPSYASSSPMILNSCREISPASFGNPEPDGSEIGSRQVPRLSILN